MSHHHERQRRGDQVDQKSHRCWETQSALTVGFTMTSSCPSVTGKTSCRPSVQPATQPPEPLLTAATAALPAAPPPGPAPPPPAAPAGAAPEMYPLRDTDGIVPPVTDRRRTAFPVSEWFHHEADAPPEPPHGWSPSSGVPIGPGAGLSSAVGASSPVPPPVRWGSHRTRRQCAKSDTRPCCRFLDIIERAPHTEAASAGVKIRDTIHF